MDRPTQNGNVCHSQTSMHACLNLYLLSFLSFVFSWLFYAFCFTNTSLTHLNTEKIKQRKIIAKNAFADYI